MITTTEKYPIGCVLFDQSLDELKKKCDHLVSSGKLSHEEAAFKYRIAMDDILLSIPDELFDKYIDEKGQQELLDDLFLEQKEQM